jgi:hypothetical protein
MARARAKESAPVQTAPAKNDAFTALLVVSVAALLAGCAMLAWVLQDYGWAVKP